MVTIPNPLMLVEVTTHVYSCTGRFGLKFPNNNYAIFDTFTSESGRTAHLSGKIAEALTSKASTLLDKDLDISHVEIFSSVIRPSAAATVGIYVPLVVKAETAEEVKEFIITTLKPIIDAEPNTTQWYACRKSKTEFHLLLLATDEAARDEHMNGPAAGIMGGKAHLWAEPAKLQFCEVVAVKVV